MKIVHIITGLSTGGAEMMLYKLLSRIDRDEFDCLVISLTDLGQVADKISSLNIPVYALGMKRGRPHPILLWKLASMLRQASPDLVQTWLYHSDLIGGIAAKMAGSIRTFWSIRQSNIDSDSNKRSTVLTAKACAVLSRWLPEKIICCSHSAMASHLNLGYTEDKMIVIPNGFDLDIFKPDTRATLVVHNELGIESGNLLVGLVARFDPQKDHKNFLDAAALVHKAIPSVHFLLCGEGITELNSQLVDWIENHELSKHIHLLGIRHDIPILVAANDIAVSSSLGEGFPNVVGEAMACAVPCVVTDVGDSALIVGDTGRIVPARNPQALANAMIDLLNSSPEQRHELGKLARERVEENFSLQNIVHQYEAAFRGKVEASVFPNTSGTA